MADFLNLTEEKIIQAIVGAATYTAEVGTFVALHIGDPGEDGTANPSTITTRQEITSFTGAAGSRSNGNELQFPNSSGGAENITHFVLHNVVTGAGGEVMKGTLTVPQSIPDGQTGRFQIGQLTLSAD